MEVVKPWQDFEEPETEDFGLSLRGRLPRHHTPEDDDDDDSPSHAVATEVFSISSKLNDQNDDEKSLSEASSDVTHSSETNGNGVLEAQNGHSNGDAKSTNGHSGLDDRYGDFLASEDGPVYPPAGFEPNELVVDGIGSRNVDEIEAIHDEPRKENGVHESMEYIEARLRKKIEVEFRELYLDKLSDKQGQHDFYCPNCNSCITKVLVRERELELELEASSVASRPERAVNRFRCTSCFSFLIPIGNWLFPKWRVEEDEENISDNGVAVSFGGLQEPLLSQASKTPVPSVVPSVTTTTIQPVPTRDLTEEIHDMNSQTVTTVVTAKIAGLAESAPPSPWSAVLFGKKTLAAVKSKTRVPEEPIRVTEEQVQSHDLTEESHDLNIQTESREILAPKVPVVTTVTTKITGLTESAPPSPWSAVLFGQKTRAAIKNKTPVPEEQVQSSDSMENEKIYDHQPPVREVIETVVSAAVTPIGSSFDSGLKLDVSLPPHDVKGSIPDRITPDLDQSSDEDILIVRNKAWESEIDVISVSTGELPMLQEVIVHSGTKLDVAVQSVDAGLARELPQTTTATLASRDTRLVLEQGSPKSWEIVKSIVYGGLVESITSLGIVTSAASGDATTKSIVALALANLIGGLFLIAHNIWELKDDQSTMHCSRTNRMVNKYQEVLGRKENFFLHATFAILSFVLFGLVPPVVYGFSFRTSNDRNLKIAAVGVASLISIAILAIGKGYTQRPNKYIKTAVYYLVIGFGVSGASYLAGEMISQLMKKIELSDTTPALAMPILGSGTSNGAWGSY